MEMTQNKEKSKARGIYSHKNSQRIFCSLILSVLIVFILFKIALKHTDEESKIQSH